MSKVLDVVGAAVVYMVIWIVVMVALFGTGTPTEYPNGEMQECYARNC